VTPWVGGGTQTVDDTARLDFKFVDPVVSVSALPNGTIYVATERQIFMVDSTGFVFRVAGDGTTGDTGDEGSPLLASFSFIENILVALDGSIFIADSGSHRIRFIGSFDGKVHAWAGDGTFGVGADGGDPATTKFVGPGDMLFAPAGGLFVADGARVRRINPFAATAVNVTVAGDAAGSGGSTGDGGPPLAARFNYITGLAQVIDPADPSATEFVVVDNADETIRLVDLTHDFVRLVAGQHDVAGLSADGALAPGLVDAPLSAASLPIGLVFSDTGNQRIRVVTTQR
jgi:hypothetical protein